MKVPPNKGMKLTKLSPAPGQMEAPSSALQRFALVRTASQLIWSDRCQVPEIRLVTLFLLGDPRRR